MEWRNTSLIGNYNKKSIWKLNIVKIETAQIIRKNIVVINAKISGNQIIFDYVFLLAMSYSSVYACIGNIKKINT